MRMENAASTASTGDQPATMACHSALPWTGPNPTSTIFPRTTNEATFDPDAMKAALETGSPFYLLAPDAYQGGPVSSVGLLALGTKVASFVDPGTIGLGRFGPS